MKQKQNKCNCGKKITKYAKRCRKCADKLHSKKMKGKNNPMYGSCRKGKDNPFYGKKHNKRAKNKMRKFRIGKLLSKETKMKISRIMKVNPPFKGHKHNYKTKLKFSEIAKKRTGIKNPNYKHGLGKFPYSIEFNNQLKLKIRERDKFTCQKCGMKEKENIQKYNRVLEIHHIDYDKQNCKEDNLITLCKICNCKTNANRDYWYAYFKYLIVM